MRAGRTPSDDLGQDGQHRGTLRRKAVFDMARDGAEILPGDQATLLKLFQLAAEDARRDRLAQAAMQQRSPDRAKSLRAALQNAQDVQLVPAAYDLIERDGRAQPDMAEVLPGQKRDSWTTGKLRVIGHAMPHTIVFVRIYDIVLCCLGSVQRITKGPGMTTIRMTAVLPAKPQRVFRALTTAEICDWWVRPGIFDTREWQGDARAGGAWSAAGIGGGGPYQLAGRFETVDPPRRLVQTWQSVGAPGPVSILTHELAPEGAGTHLTLSHDGIDDPEIRERTRAGWETSLQRLAEVLAG